MSFYHHPIKRDNAMTHVIVSGYSINQPTESDIPSKMVQSKLTIELMFTSNDCSPAKYEAFLNKFQHFLNDNYQ
ncbi:hypothetical protein BK143_09630 [Paenibacillus peoriae]|uniref:Uncharacterized protein n=1 Tax=Paenibacillus polymyxa TaxID=1406 RepID=A0ABX2Z7P9_PAEPO|nr:hypothetical protein A7312_16370 [Paenibacillus polymyxa]OMF32371.1 hypothetical protein BK134_11120 [Paenibacillus peoriae]OMF72517.1 hypothetical protein BK143_09630 [Paenibacillus peoriae]